MKSDVDHLHFLGIILFSYGQNMLSLNDQEMRSMKSILIRRWDPWNPSWSGDEIHEIHPDQEKRSMRSILIKKLDLWNPSWSGDKVHAIHSDHYNPSWTEAGFLLSFINKNLDPYYPSREEAGIEIHFFSSSDPYNPSWWGVLDP